MSEFSGMESDFSKEESVSGEDAFTAANISETDANEIDDGVASDGLDPETGLPKEDGYVGYKIDTGEEEDQY